VSRRIGNVYFDRMSGHFLGSAGQEKQRSDHDQQENKENDECAHRPFRFRASETATAFADRSRRCIARTVQSLRQRLDRPIVLVGLMGAGKSTVGRRIAVRLGLPFVDTDAEIEAAAGLTAAEIFEQYGEADFRDGERRLVARLMDGERKVIATGGGAFVNDETRRLLNENAITIWLDAPIDVLFERTARRDTRPLLRNEDPRGTLERLLEERRPAYSEAHIHVRTGGGAHSNVVEAVLKAIDERLSKKG
jgi:shikimate kinase